MVDPSLALLLGATVLLVGFGAHLAFQRYHIPDFLVLILLGAGLAEIPFAPFGPSLLGSLGSLLPVFLQLTIAFILFEGGLSLKTHQLGRAVGPLAVHIVAAFLLTFALIWFLASRVFGLSEVASLVLATALANPSASIALSFAPRMQLGERAEAGVVLEGVVTNVFAVMGILYVLEWAGAGSQISLLAYGLETAAAAGIGVAVAALWRPVTRALGGREFVYIASLSVAIIVYAAAQLFLFQNGAVAVFVFGLALGYHRPTTISEHIDEFVGEFARPVERLRTFQSEVTFALRTFFFLYLGLLLVSEWAGLSTLWVGALLTLVFVAGRAPSSLAVGRVLHFEPRERRVLLAAMGRGLTDVILILLAVQANVLPPADATFMLSLLPAAVLISAFVCAGLLVWAGRTRRLSTTRASASSRTGPGTRSANVRAAAGDAPPVLNQLSAGEVSRTGWPPGPSP